MSIYTNSDRTTSECSVMQSDSVDWRNQTAARARASRVSLAALSALLRLRDPTSPNIIVEKDKENHLSYIRVSSANLVQSSSVLKLGVLALLLSSLCHQSIGFSVDCHLGNPKEKSEIKKKMRINKNYMRGYKLSMKI